MLENNNQVETNNRISMCIKQLEEIKTEIKAKISEKRIGVSIQKAQKSFLTKINQACTSSMDILTKINNIQLNAFQIYKYECKTNKLIQSIKYLNIDSLLKGFADDIKCYVDQIKKIKALEELPKIKEESQIIKFDRVIKIQNEPIDRLLFVNRKLVEICENSVTIEKNTINKKFDSILPIKLQTKQKQILFTLHEGTIGLYTDKLTLHSFKKFNYVQANIVAVYQIKNYIFVAETHKISRINLNNLNQVLVRTYRQNVTGLGSQLYRNCVMVGCLNRIIFLDFDTLEEVTVISLIGRVTKLFILKESYVVVGVQANGVDTVQVFKDLQQINLDIWSSNCQIVESVKFCQQKIFITSQLLIFTLISESQGQYQILKRKGINIQTKVIKSAVAKGYQIYCLSENGRKIYVYTV